MVNFPSCESSLPITLRAHPIVSLVAGSLLVDQAVDQLSPVSPWSFRRPSAPQDQIFPPPDLQQQEARGTGQGLQENNECRLYSKAHVRIYRGLETIYMDIKQSSLFPLLFRQSYLMPPLQDSSVRLEGPAPSKLPGF